MDKQYVDPELWPLVEGFPPIDLGPDTLAAFRAAMTQMSVPPDRASHADVIIEEVRIPDAQGQASIRCLLFTRASGPSRGALLHVHGGGFVMGSPEMDAARNIDLVRATGCSILSVDYRLAPEHPQPAALEDCHTALTWLGGRLAQSGMAPVRIGLIGESAGGGLAASVALLARDRRSVPLVCQALIYPMLVPPAHSVDAIRPDARTGRHIWTRTSNAYCWSALLGDAAPDPATIAGLAPDLAHLPPTYIAVGELDLFVHDNLVHAGRLMAAGCTVEAHLYPGAIHGFDRMVEAAVSRRFSRDLVDFLSRHLA